ncbi:MAG: amidase, partial [Rhodanobacter sp.]
MIRSPFARTVFITTSLTCAGLASAPLAAQDTSDTYASIATLQQRMSAGTLNSQALVQQFITRIQHIDQAGLGLHAVLQVNPDALKLAGALDKKHAKAHGPL